MTSFSTAENAASMVIGADLRVEKSSLGWRQLGLGGRGRLKGKRIDELFPAADIRAEVLDALASGQPRENVLLPVEKADGIRYLSGSLSPVMANGRKPRKILLRASELAGELLVDEDSGEILEMNAAAAEVLGGARERWMGRSVWGSGILSDAGKRRASLAILERKRILHLGRFALSLERGQQVELEGALVSAEG
ncbi:MAG: PAS domain-containing protein [Bryobacteraceae bacterium]